MAVWLYGCMAVSLYDCVTVCALCLSVTCQWEGRLLLPLHAFLNQAFDLALLFNTWLPVHSHS